MTIAVVNFPGSSSADIANALIDTFNTKVQIVEHYEEDLTKYDVIILPGGFSYGDYLRPGALAAQTNIAREIRLAAEEGKLVIGIGNGFQVLTELQLLPGMFLPNEQLKFLCKFTTLQVVNASTPFTKDYETGETIELPVAHEYGNYFCDEKTLQQLQTNEQIVFTYENNPNGSIANIAGITNENHNVIGMMPHPERALDNLLGSTDGKQLFQSLIKSWRETDVTNV